MQAAKSAEHVQADEEERWQSALQAKDAQIQELLTERDRLEAALASIKGEITSVASPVAAAQPTAAKAKSLMRASVDSATLRQAECATLCFSSRYALTKQALQAFDSMSKQW